SDQFTCCELRQVFLFSSVSSEVNNWQQTDTAFGAERSGKRSRASDVLADERAARLVETKATVLFRYVGADQSEVSRFANEFARQFPIVLFELIETWVHLVVDELPRGIGNHAMLFGEIFRGEDLLRVSLLDQK